MVIAVIGKGGVGKTTITALLLRRLIDARQTPVLAVDADPSNCLGPALGLGVGSTLARLRDRFREDAERPASMSKVDYFALGAEDALLEQAGFDLLTMGHPEGPGCYCFVNNLIRTYLERLGRKYRHVLLDCEAGLEHLSRRTAGQPDGLVSVTTRARMATETVRRALGIYHDLHGRLPSRLDLVVNATEPGEALNETARAAAPDGVVFGRVFAVPWDDAIRRAEAGAVSLLGLASDSPALKALAGWETDG